MTLKILWIEQVLHYLLLIDLFGVLQNPTDPARALVDVIPTYPIQWALHIANPVRLKSAVSGIYHKPKSPE